MSHNLNPIPIPPGYPYNAVLLADGKPYWIQLHDGVKLEVPDQHECDNIMVYGISDVYEVYCSVRITRPFPMLSVLDLGARYISLEDLHFLLANSPKLVELKVSILIEDSGEYLIPKAPVRKLKFHCQNDCTLNLANYEGTKVEIYGEFDVKLKKRGKMCPTRI